MTNTLRTLASDDRGASIIELGIALPILSTMLIGMVDLSTAYAAKLKLEQAAQSAIETIQQQGYTHSTASLAALKAEAETRAGTGSTATTTAYLECRNGTTKSTQTLPGTCPTGQTSAKYVSVTLTQSFTPMFALKFAGANASGNYTINGAAALRFQ